MPWARVKLPGPCMSTESRLPAVDTAARPSRRQHAGPSGDIAANRRNSPFESVAMICAHAAALIWCCTTRIRVVIHVQPEQIAVPGRVPLPADISIFVPVQANSSLARQRTELSVNTITLVLARAAGDAASVTIVAGGVGRSCQATLPALQLPEQVRQRLPLPQGYLPHHRGPRGGPKTGRAAVLQDQTAK